MTPFGSFLYFAAACRGGSFLGLPTWYKYLPCQSGTTPQITNINDIWLIVAALVEVFVRVAGLLAVLFIIYAGFQLMTSQGEPNKVTQARTTMQNALVGLIIAILAASIVNYIATRIK